MDSAEDQAANYVHQGVDALLRGKLEEAEQFLLKAEEIHSTEEAKLMLKELESRKRDKKEEQEAPSYSREQEQIVERIQSCHSYYEILGVAKTATIDEIKKAYKKLALQVHPDKNNAPGAEEAFKLVSLSGKILSDPDKRRFYDEEFSKETPQMETSDTVFRDVMVTIGVGVVLAFGINYLAKKFQEKPKNKN